MQTHSKKSAWFGRFQSLAEHRIFGLTHTEITCRGIGSNDAEGDSIGSIFGNWDEERSFKGALVSRIEHLKTVYHPIADQRPKGDTTTIAALRTAGER